MLQQLSDPLQALLGLGREASEISAGQMVARAVVVYTFTLAVVRLGSTRFLGKATAFDVIIGIMIGSVMSRGINGSAELLPTLLGGAALIAMHWLFAVTSFRAGWFGRLVKGKPVLLIEDGRVSDQGQRKTSVTRDDLEEALRLQGSPPDPSRIRLAYLERNGNLSVIPRGEEPRVVDVRVEQGVQTVRIEIG